MLFSRNKNLDEGLTTDNSEVLNNCLTRLVYSLYTFEANQSLIRGDFLAFVICPFLSLLFFYFLFL